MDKDYLSYRENKFHNFSKSYHQSAFVQKYMASQLVSLAQENIDFSEKNNIQCLELGCGTGHLTQKIVTKWSPYGIWNITDRSSNMIQECQKNVNHPTNFHFKTMSALHIDSDYSFICSNALVQWLHLENHFQHLHNHTNQGAIVIFSSFGEKHFYQLYHILKSFLFENFSPPITLVSLSMIQQLSQKYGFKLVAYFEEELTVYYSSLFSFLKNIQQFGGGATTLKPLTIGEIKLVQQKYQQKFCDSKNQASMSWNPVYVILQKC